MPFGHDHGMLVANGADIPELVMHLECSHAGSCIDTWAGWHLHWVWIGDEACGLTGASRTAASQTMISDDDTLVSSLEPAGSLNLWLKDRC